MTTTAQKQNQKYLGLAYSVTRSYLNKTYNRLPVKVPQFVATTFKLLDDIAEPVIYNVTDFVDDQVDSTLVKLEPITKYTSEVANTQVQRYNNLVDQGKLLRADINKKSQQLLDKGVDLALHNKASELVISGADAVTNKVFTSIEDQIQQISKLVKRKLDKEDGNKQEQKAVKSENQKGGSIKNYHDRVLNLAQGISEISNHLYNVLRKEVKSKQGKILSQYLIQARQLVQAHFNASRSLVTMTLITPTLVYLSNNQDLLKELISTLKEKMTEKQLINYLKDQIQSARGQLTRKQMKNIYLVLRDTEYFNKVKQSLQNEQAIYRKELSSEQQKQQDENENANQNQNDLLENQNLEENQNQNESQNQKTDTQNSEEKNNKSNNAQGTEDKSNKEQQN